MAPREELADGSRLGRSSGFAPERHAKSLTESAARRRSENAAMARREARRLGDKVPPSGWLAPIGAPSPSHFAREEGEGRRTPRRKE
jgi:hypothetical protein